jgi:hypothetical protein
VDELGQLAGIRHGELCSDSKNLVWPRRRALARAIRAHPQKLRKVLQATLNAATWLSKNTLPMKNSNASPSTRPLTTLAMLASSFKGRRSYVLISFCQEQNVTGAGQSGEEVRDKGLKC